MPEFGVKATNIAPADVKPFIAPGVETRQPTINAGVAQAQMWSELGSQAVEAYKGYQLADLEKEQQKNIDAYTEHKAAAVDVAGTSQALELAWGKGDAQPTSDLEGISAVEKSHAAALDRLKRATEQGVMSPEELNARILKTTREAVAKNPGLYPELLARSQRVLELSGIQQVVKLDQAIAESKQKQQQKMLDNIVQLAKEKNIPVQYNPDGSISNIGQVKQQIDIVQQQDFAAEQVKRATTAVTEQQKLQGIQFAKEFGIAGANGLINEASANAIEAFNGAGDYAQKVAYARNLFNAVRQTLGEKTQGISHDPAVKEVTDYTEKQLKAIEENLVNFKSGEDAAKYLENSVAMLRHEGFIRVTQQTGMDPDTLRTVSGFMQGVIGNRVIQQNPKLANSLVDTIANMAKGVTGGLGTDVTAKDHTGKPASTNFIGHAAKQAGNGDVAAVRTLNNTILTLSSELANPEKFTPTPEGTSQKFLFFDSYMQELGKEQNKIGLAQISDTARSAASTNLAEYMDLTLRDMDKQIKAAEASGVKVVWNALPDGRISVETSDPRLTQLLTQNYVSRVNWGLGAFANLQGVDKKQAASTFYPSYREYFGLAAGPGRVSQAGTTSNETRPNSSNPLNLTIPGKTGQFQTFKDQITGIRAASDQLDRYYNGKTTGTKLQTVGEIARLWNNENEPGSMPANKYIATIVRHSGLDPNKKLDFSDPKTKAALIYGMSIAEGNSLNPKDILFALTQRSGPSMKNPAAASTVYEDIIAPVLDVLIAAGEPFRQAATKVANQVGMSAEQVIQAEKDYRNRIQHATGIDKLKQNQDDSIVPKEFR